eukprot:TRINITY_DN21882_c0_g1_i1.p1 TRINITY_DN21882_c0_g1~~TRINITY_DN21882_c0_g1_i1.p1  ORF type:complete len:280 (+),score=41.90 TRINITY_DN21882_c0_g1_i1:28-867(+)
MIQRAWDRLTEFYGGDDAPRSPTPLPIGKEKSPTDKETRRVYGSFSDQTASSITQRRPVSNTSYDSSSNTDVVIDIPDIYYAGSRRLIERSQIKNTREDSDSTFDDGRRKVCERCKKFYTQKENEGWACAYHPGKFDSEAITMSSTSRRWTCCSQESPKAEGCLKDHHKEDTRTMGILSAFDKALLSTPHLSEEDLENMAFVDINAKSPEKEATSVESSPSKPRRRIKETKHMMNKGDTLQGLAVKYNVAVDQIKKRNKIFSEAEMSIRKFVFIPPETN